MENQHALDRTHKLSIIIPCYNEEKTLKACVERVLEIADESLHLEIIIVDDCSTDSSLHIARILESKYPQVIALQHESNLGKGAALRSGFRRASGQLVAIQDADLEYNPEDLKRLLVPLINGHADVVFGSRFLSNGAHRVHNFWHYLGNRFLTFLSNMFTDLHLTDMETCYKVFRREVIQNIELKENRFGVEPELVAKIAHQRLRVYEVGISYSGRTFEEGKKIGMRDGMRALYCIFRYNAHKAPLPIQLLIYLFIGGISAFVNLIVFLSFLSAGFTIVFSAIMAFLFAAIVNYILCILFLFRHKSKWNSPTEVIIYLIVTSCIGFLDIVLTKFMIISVGFLPTTAKLLATAFGFVLNFCGRKYLVFPEFTNASWRSTKKYANSQLELTKVDKKPNPVFDESGF